MEIQHPGVRIQEEIVKRGRSQKSFAQLIGKRVSEVNELIKGKRNITIQRDILLGIVFDTAPKKWLIHQMEYDYQTSKQSVDVKKLAEIGVRKHLLEQQKGDGEEVYPKKPSKEKDIPKPQAKKTGDTIASTGKTSTIQSTKIVQEHNKKSQAKKQDRQKDHEIFKNF